MFDEEERLVYEARMQSLADIESKIASAEEKGIEKGKEEAFKIIALNMLKMGEDISTIAKTTGLTQRVIEQLITDQEK